MVRGPSSSSGEHSTSTMVSLVNRSNNGEEDHDDQPRTDWRSIYFITVICIMDAMKISAVMANSWPYLTSVDSQADEEFFGLSKSAFTLGAIVASLLSGWLSNRISHTKPPILAGQLLSSLCCLFYANLELIPRNRRYGFLISEILFGVSTGAISTWRVHIAMSSTDADRSKATSLIGFAINLGFVLAPMVVLLLGYLLAQGIRLPWGSQFNIFTAPIYLMSLLSLSGAILLFFCFDGQMHQLHPASRGEKVGKQLPTEKSPLEMTVPIEGQIPASEDQKSAAWSSRPDFAAILACFCARFCFMAFILYLMALSAPYSMSVFGWTGKQAVTYVMLSQSVMGLMGLLVCLGYTLRLLSRFKERFCVLAALLLMLAFFLASFPWPFLSGRLPEPTFETRIVNGTSMESLVSHGCDRRKYDWCERTPAINIVVYHVALILCLGLAMPVGQLNLDVLYSRLLGPIKQGTMQGLFVAVGDLVSLCGPLLITAVYQFKGSRPIWLGEIFVFGLGIAIWLCCYSRLVPNNKNYAPVAPVVDSAAVEADNEWNEATNVLRRQTSTVQSSEKQLLKE